MIKLLIDLGHPAIAESRDRAQDALILAVIAEFATYAQDGLSDQGVADFGFAPDRRNKFITADGAIAMLDQVAKAIKHRGR